MQKEAPTESQTIEMIMRIARCDEMSIETRKKAIQEILDNTIAQHNWHLGYREACEQIKNEANKMKVL